MGNKDPRFNRCTFKWADRNDLTRKTICKTYTLSADCETNKCSWNYPPALVSNNKKCNNALNQVISLSLNN